MPSTFETPAVLVLGVWLPESLDREANVFFRAAAAAAALFDTENNHANWLDYSVKNTKKFYITTSHKISNTVLHYAPLLSIGISRTQ